MLVKIGKKDYLVMIHRKFGQKRVYIRVNKELEIIATANLVTPRSSIEKIVMDNIEKVTRMIEIQEKKNKNNEGFYYLGKQYEVKYIDEDTLYIKDNVVYMNKDYDVDKFYKKEAKKLFLERLEYNYNNFTRKIPHPTLRIRKMTTRWGVCNIETHKITLNLELIKRNTKYLDYVIIHELTHLVHGDHSSAFWKLVGDNMPNYKELREEMKAFL